MYCYLAFQALRTNKKVSILSAINIFVAGKFSAYLFLVFGGCTAQKCHYPPGNHHASQCPLPKKVLFPGHNHLLTTSTDDPLLVLELSPLLALGRN